MVNYLLGGMTDEEQAGFEDRYFADDNLFEQLQTVKQELVDAYVRGQLDANLRERFDRHFLNSPEGRQRLAFAQALRKTLNERPHRVEPEPATWRENWFEQWSPGTWAFVAVTLLLATGLGWLFLENRQLRRELVRIRKDKEQSDLVKLQPRPLDTPMLIPAASPSPTPAKSSIPTTVPAVFLLPTVRDPGDEKIVNLPDGAQQLPLHFTLNFDPPSNSVAAVLRVKNGPVIARRQLQVRVTGSGLSATWIVSAAILKPGDYAVTLTGLDAAKQKKIADYRFLVAR